MICEIKRAGRRLLVQANAAIISIFLVVAVLAVADEVEGTSFPILRDQSTEAAPRTDPDRVCWHWAFRKARAAYPVSFSWVMEHGSARYSITPVPDGSSAPIAFRDVEKGEVVDRRFCAPAPRSGDGPVTIRGHAFYRTHGFWTVKQEFAPVTIP